MRCLSFDEFKAVRVTNDARWERSGSDDARLHELYTVLYLRGCYMKEYAYEINGLRDALEYAEKTKLLQEALDV